MAKLNGTIRIKPNEGTSETGPFFEVDFLPYSGKLNTKPVRVTTYDDLVEFLTRIKLPEDEASRWAGRARSEGLMLISGIERTDTQLRDWGLLA